MRDLKKHITVVLPENEYGLESMYLFKTEKIASQLSSSCE
jgi:hypothetical protein